MNVPAFKPYRYWHFKAKPFYVGEFGFAFCCLICGKFIELDATEEEIFINDEGACHEENVIHMRCAEDQ